MFTFWLEAEFPCRSELAAQGQEARLVGIASNLRRRVFQYPSGRYLTLEFLPFEVNSCRVIWAGRVP